MQNLAPTSSRHGLSSVHAAGVGNRRQGRNVLSSTASLDLDGSASGGLLPPSVPIESVMPWLTDGLPAPPSKHESTHEALVIDEDNDPLASGEKQKSGPSFAVGLRPLKEASSNHSSSRRPPPPPPPQIIQQPDSPSNSAAYENARFKAEVEAAVAARTAEERAAAEELKAEVEAEIRAASLATTPMTLHALLASLELNSFGYERDMQAAGLSLARLLAGAREQIGADGAVEALLKEGGVGRVGHRMKLATRLRAMAAT